MAVDLFLLCGFLGSGKTTLLVDYLRDPAASDTGVIVNGRARLASMAPSSPTTAATCR